MKRKILILFILTLLGWLPSSFSQNTTGSIRFDFYGDTLGLPASSSINIPFSEPLSAGSVQHFYNEMNDGDYQAIVQNLVFYKEHRHLDDWLYYQLIRSVAEQLSPKAENYYRYTLYKWFLLIKSGYAATVKTGNNKLLLYIQSDEEIYDVPYHLVNGKQYVCLNYHNYGNVDFEKEKFTEVAVDLSGKQQPFSYKITRLPDFKAENYTEKDLQFDYEQKDYHFKVLLNQQVKKIFANYPVVDYSCYFNIPLSNTTYGSLIPALKENVKKMNQQKGVDYLMRFTRYAFAFETDTKVFGKEKRLSPEQTLLYEHSDCEDRAAFFFYLVKEIYNLPMIVLSYPEHITIAVKFDSPLKHPITYKGNNYWVCEATPQHDDLSLGQSIHNLRKVPYDVVYEYNPQKK